MQKIEKSARDVNGIGTFKGGKVTNAIRQQPELLLGGYSVRRGDPMHHSLHRT
jgi:hypothetical protein